MPDAGGHDIGCGMVDVGSRSPDPASGDASSARCGLPVAGAGCLLRRIRLLALKLALRRTTQSATLLPRAVSAAMLRGRRAPIFAGRDYPGLYFLASVQRYTDA